MYHYLECGKNNIWLLNGYNEIDTPYGKGVSINNVLELQEIVDKQNTDIKIILRYEHLDGVGPYWSLQD